MSGDNRTMVLICENKELENEKMIDLKEYYLSPAMCKYVLNPKRGGFNFFNPDICHTITTRLDAGIGTFVSDEIDFVEINNKALGGTEPNIIHLKNGKTLEFDGENFMEIKPLGYYTPSQHNNTAVLDKEGVCSTVMENHGMFVAVVEPNCKQAGILCGEKWEKNDEFNRRVYDGDGVAPTVTAVCGGNQERKIIEPTIAASRGRGEDNHQELEIGSSESSNALTSVQKDNLLLEPAPLRWERTEECKQKRRETGDVGMGFKEGKYLAPKPDGVTNTLTTFDKDNMCIEPKIPIKSATKAGYELAGDGDYIDLQYPNSETRRGKVQEQQAGTWCCTDAQGVLEYEPDFRIRKLTETECFRLMGVKDEDSNRVHKNQSKSSMYHLAGDSIVTAVLMAIFGELFEADWQSKVEELTTDLTKEWREAQNA